MLFSFHTAEIFFETLLLSLIRCGRLVVLNKMLFR